MEWVCGPFTPALVPDWLSKCGPAVAALVAVTIYWLNRRQARNDLKEKRKVLRVMLASPVAEIVQFAAVQIAFVHGHSDRDVRTARIAVFAKEGALNLPPCDRMLDLQIELMKVADRGDDVIADFIEACRSYQDNVAELARIKRRADEKRGNDAEFNDWIEQAAEGVRETLQAIKEKGRLAQAQLNTLLDRDPAVMRRNQKRGRSAA